MRRSIKRVLQFSVGILLARVLGLIVWEYQNYFPPDFQSAFLIGMRPRFHGIYPIAFFVHITTGPIVLTNLAIMRVTASRLVPRRHVRNASRIHRRAGRVLALMVLVLLVPSGVVMSFFAHAGPVAGLGLLALAIATGVSMFRSLQMARRRRLAEHRVWATRCSLLLISPLVLRLATGVAIIAERESATFFQYNAWLSWIVPLVVHETWRLLHHSAGTAKSLQAESLQAGAPQTEGS